MKLVKFKKGGKWADPNTLIPQIEVEEGQKVEVSDKLADLIVGSGNGEIIVIPLTEEEQEELDAENARLTEEADANKDIVDKLQAAEKDAEKLSAANAELEATNADLTAKLKELAENTELDEMELAELKENHDKANSKIDALEADLEKMKKSAKKTPAAKDKGEAESK